MKICPQVWCGKGILWPEGMRSSMLRRQQDKQLTWILLCPLSPTIYNRCSGVLNLGQNKLGEKKISTFWDRGIREKYFSGHFFFSLAATGHCSQVWYVRHGPSGDCPAHRLQVRQLFSQGCHHHKHVSPLQSIWYLFVLIMLNRQYYKTNKQTNKIILLMFSTASDLLWPEVCDKDPVWPALPSQFL